MRRAKDLLSIFSGLRPEVTPHTVLHVQFRKQAFQAF